MRRIAFLLVLVVFATVGVGGAGAVDTPEPPDPPGGNRSTATTTAPPGERMVQEISPATYVVSYEYDETQGLWTITIESEMPTTLTISEATMMSSGGSRTFAIRKYNIERGRTTIQFHADPVDGSAAVTLVTPESVNLGRGAFLQAGAQGGNPFTIFGGIDGLLAGVAISIVSALVAAGVLVRKESEGVEVAD